MTTGVTPPERLGQTCLPNGRGLGWAEWGPESGTPVLLCSGSATSRWLGLPTDTIRRLGVRLITVDRPGLGASSASAGWTLHDWARDIRRFVQVRELLGMATIGFSMGAPFALACAAVSAVVGVSLVSGTDELAHPVLRSALEPEAGMLVKRVAASAADAELLIANSADADVLWDVVAATSRGADRRVYSDPAFDRSYRRALADGFSQGPAGYARETVLAMSRWPFDPSTISVPVDLWYGDQDTNPFHSPDLGASLARRIPSARRFIVPNAGSALLWTHTDRILRSLLNRIAAQYRPGSVPPLDRHTAV